MSKFSDNLRRNFFVKKNLWLSLAILIFAFISLLVSGGNFYNQFTDGLRAKTNGIISLPKAKEIPFSLGLDLQGGTHLVYKADVSKISEADRAGAIESVRDVIERRVNLFGVSEPIVQTNKSANGEYKIVAELAGIKDVEAAIKMIGETPFLEFKERTKATSTKDVVASSSAPIELDLSADWKNTELTGKYLKRATLAFNGTDNSPEVSLEFNNEGAKLFGEITGRNIGSQVAIFLDGFPISMPNVNDKIRGGKAVITGNFTVEEAKLLITRLNSGALPVPISLISQKTVEASLGVKSIENSVKAGLIGLLLVSLFMIIYYRFPGSLAVLSLLVYGLTVLAIFKAIPIWLALIMIIFIIGSLFFIFSELKVLDLPISLLFIVIGVLLFFYSIKPITLSLSGIAGFILSVGMAVDANILIFARLREELRSGKIFPQALDQAFRRAWPSIRDGNISTIITCFVLIFFGTSAIQGFGTALFIGIAVSLFSSIVITRTLLKLFGGNWLEKKLWLVGPGLKKKNENVNN